MTPLHTQSLCPVCLRRIDAAYERLPTNSPNVVLRKICPEHGAFHAPAWTMPPAAPAPATFEEWRRDKCPSYPAAPQTTAKCGCPFDCGLCPSHAQHTCTGLVEITRRCNLACPLCYAESGGSGAAPDPPIAEVALMLTNLKKAGGTCHVQISGGEPTVREDLPAIVSLARRQGFSLVQVNTNGLRLGGEVGYAERLRQAGADSVYLQYDGVSAAAFAALRGRSDIIEGKNKAIQFCGAAGLGVVLVSTLVCGVNDGEMGALLRFALTQGPTVRGVHFQPAASFGRFPWHIESAPRLTLPEIMVKLVEQTPDLIQMEDFHPPGCEHALCSFSAVYTRNGAGNSLTPSGRNEQDKICCPPPPPGLSDAPPHAAHGARKAIHFTTRHWKAPKLDTPDLKDDFAAFVSKAGLERRFTVSAMAFQDALSLDLARIRGCCIHVARPDGRLVPFCLHNLTSRDGVRLYA